MDSKNKLDLTVREVTDRISTAVVVGAFAVAREVPGVADHAALLAGTAVVASAMGFALGKSAEVFVGQRLPQFSKGFVAAHRGRADEPLEISAKQAEIEAAANRDNPEYHEVMFRAFRQMQDAVDPCVVEVLGYLAGQYTHAGRKPDQYFRALGRALCDLEANELDELRRLVAGVLHYRSEIRGPVAAVVVEEVVIEGNRSELVIRVASPKQQLWVRHIPSAVRLFGLLRREGLAQDQGPAQGMRREMGENAIRIPVETVERMFATLQPLG